jgi:hypothetical protein
MDHPDAAPPTSVPVEPLDPSRPLDDAPAPDAAPAPDVATKAPPQASGLLRELPYLLVLALTLFGVAYMSFSKQSIVGYWEVLGPLIGVVCVGNGWRHARDRSARLRLIWAQVLHWAAFLVAMNLILLSGVQANFSSNATGLMILTLLALGTFTAGVHVLSWQIGLLGVIMALGVPALAWIERSALFLLLILLVLAAIVLAFWWNARAGRREPNAGSAKN